MSKTKKKWGDKRDGRLLTDVDSMHYIVPRIHPNRCDNEAYMSITVDLTETNKYIDAKNAEDPEFRYKLFQIIVCAALKTLTLRPKMNRFIRNKNLYMRNELTAAFTIKKVFKDDGAEGLAVIHAEPGDTLETVRQKTHDQIVSGKSDKVDSSSESMDDFQKMPRFLSNFLVYAVTVLDRHGIAPKSLVETDPYQCSIILSNIGSIKMKAGYHHLANWGTNSVFIIVGEKGWKPFFDKDGNVTMKETVELGLTIDERLADGYYYAGTIRLLKKLIEHPELLEAPLTEEVEY